MLEDDEDNQGWNGDGGLFDDELEQEVLRWKDTASGHVDGLQVVTEELSKEWKEPFDDTVAPDILGEVTFQHTPPPDKPEQDSLPSGQQETYQEGDQLQQPSPFDVMRTLAEQEHQEYSDAWLKSLPAWQQELERAEISTRQLVSPPQGDILLIAA